MAQGHENAKAAAALRAASEAAVAAGKPADHDLLAAYSAYIKLEQGAGDPARVQVPDLLILSMRSGHGVHAFRYGHACEVGCASNMSEESCRLSCAHRQAPAQILLSPQVMYERALAVFPLTHFLWLQYARYLEATLKSTSLVMPVYARAARNCPWVGTVWGRYVNALDRSGAAEEQQATVYARALSAGLQVRCSLFARCFHSSSWPNQQRWCLCGVCTVSIWCQHGASC